MNKFLLSLIITSSCASLMGMQMDSQAITIDSKTIAIPMQLDDIEAYSNRPFSELIEEDHAADKPYLFARIDTEDTPDKKERRQYSHYVDAAKLNTQLVQKTHPYFQPSESAKNPISRLLIKQVAYFMITKESKETCTQVCTYDEFYPVDRWNKLFPHNQLTAPSARSATRGEITSVTEVRNNTEDPGLAELQTIARNMNDRVAGYTRRIEITGITAAPSGSIQEASPLMGNQTLRNRLKDCLTRIDHCCNQSLHDCCNDLGNCIGASVVGVVGAGMTVAFCAMDTACLPVACISRPCQNPNDRSRNDAFYYCMRSTILNSLDIKTCYGIDITTSKKDCSDAYCSCLDGSGHHTSSRDDSGW